IYEQSCEAYKHKGKTSGFYFIDVDGSGPLNPQKVYCNMTDKTWMVIQHNNTELTKLKSSSGITQHLAYFNYSANMEQLRAIINQAEYCEQELFYHCKKWCFVYMVDGEDGRGTDILGRSKTRQSEVLLWHAGRLPEFQSLLTNDSGILSFKEHLPVTKIAFGDINRVGSEAAYKVGHLQCHGDTSSEVVFSYDVGNGPFEVRVKTPTPLNDNQWHYVRAERNVKEALLQVDQLPVRTQKAPKNGHIHLQLNSQLFVGGTASRQKGFLGCIRSLQLNGVTLDLEERAKITPGVKPGCPGHCSSYGRLCQNEGKCMEKYNGFSCDCTFSAFTGPFCTKEVSAYFKPGMSVAYTFKEPHELDKNASSQSSSIYSDLTLRGESIAFSFRTTQAPVLLFYVSTYYQEYLAVLLNRNGYLEVKYKLQNEKDVEVFKVNTRNIANGQLHKVVIKRQAEALTVQIDQNTREEFNLTSDTEFSAIRSVVIGKIYDSSDFDPEVSRLNALGFSGCLSGVQFNSIAPLKAALLHPSSSPVTVRGQLVESQCGASSPSNPFAAETTHSLSDHSGTADTSEPIVNAIRSDSALIGGVIAVVIFVIFCTLAIMARFLYRRKETFQSREAKGPKPDESPDFPFNNEPNSQNMQSENQKEFLM
ncbi:hypothetical protein Z043_102337, partial [Scleropages formosus]